MKKIYVLVILSICYHFAKAQYTLTSVSNPVPGDILNYTELDSVGLFFGSSGTSQTWNYSAITTYGYPIKSHTFVPLSSVPNNTMFPGGTIGVDEGLGNFGVLSNNSTKFEYLGYATATASNCWTYSDPLKPYSLPFAYGSTSTDTYLLIQPTNTTVGTFTTYGDGTGTLQLPSITIPNVLKLNYIQYERDTTSGGSVITYTILMNQYYASVSKFPLLEVQTMIITTNTGTTSSTAFYRLGRIFYTTISGISNQTNALHYNVFPNPVATGELFVSITPTQAEITIEIYNVLGQAVKTILIEGSSGSASQKINVSDLPKGIYYLKLKTGAQEAVKKLIIE